MTVVTPQARDRFRRAVWHVSGYVPTPTQAAYHADDSRLKLVAGGIRAGKSKSTAMDCVADLLVENGLIWIVGPDYEQAKPEWDYLFQPLQQLGLIRSHSAPERGGRTFETTWGAKVQTKSSDDTRSLASFAPHVILMVEAGQQSYDTFQKVLERGLEHNAKIILSGTFEGALSWYADMFERWSGDNPEMGKSFSLPSWSNHYIFPGGRDDPKIKQLEAAMPEELFMERCGAVPFRPAGLVFKEFDRAKHVRKLEFDPDLPIEISVDPATHTYAILAIQWRPIPGLVTRDYKGMTVPLTEVRVIDEVYAHDIIAQEIIPWVKEKPWFKFVKSGTIDIAGTQRQANKSQVQIWFEETGIQLRSQYVFIEDSIDVIKLRLKEDMTAKQPLLLLDYRLRSDKSYQGRANGILSEFGLYKWPEWEEGQAMKVRPVDANNDALKALGYWLYDRFGPVKERRKRAKRQIASYF